MTPRRKEEPYRNASTTTHKLLTTRHGHDTHARLLATIRQCLEDNSADDERALFASLAPLLCLLYGGEASPSASHSPMSTMSNTLQWHLTVKRRNHKLRAGTMDSVVCF